MKPSRVAYARNRWPLIELNLSRDDCVSWLSARNIPIPHKSACTFCPYRDDTGWRTMKIGDPESFADAVQVENAIRNGMKASGKQIVSNPWFVHSSMIPLAEIDFDAKTIPSPQIDMFNNECEGMCGV